MEGSNDCNPLQSTGFPLSWRDEHPSNPPHLFTGLNLSGADWAAVTVDLLCELWSSTRLSTLYAQRLFAAAAGQFFTGTCCNKLIWLVNSSFILFYFLWFGSFLLWHAIKIIRFLLHTYIRVIKKRNNYIFSYLSQECIQPQPLMILCTSWTIIPEMQRNARFN